MKINISGLSSGIQPFDVSASVQELGLPENYTGTVIAHVTLEKTSWQIHAALRCTVNALCECDRCADGFTAPLEASFQAVYSWNASEQGQEEDDNFFLLADNQHAIDVSGLVREYLLLALPVKNLCRDDCRGLCPLCGTNLNESTCMCTTRGTDPRWDALQKLATRNE